MSSCSAIKADGGRCKGKAIKGSSYCLSHDPNKAEARRRRASKGGKSGGRGRPQAEIEDIKTTLYRLADDIESGALEKGVGAVLVQVYNAVRACVEDQRKIKETEELEARIEELEGQSGGQQWGA